MSEEDKSVIAAAAADATVTDAPTALDAAVAEQNGDFKQEQEEQEEEEEVDEYLNAYEALERDAATIELSDRIKDYHLLLLNSRYDDQAIKIKEQSIYR